MAITIADAGGGFIRVTDTDGRNDYFPPTLSVRVSTYLVDGNSNYEKVVLGDPSIPASRPWVIDPAEVVSPVVADADALAAAIVSIAAAGGGGGLPTSPLTLTSTGGVSVAGTVASGAVGVTISNVGGAVGTVQGLNLVPGASREYGGFGRPLPAIAYDASGTVFELEVLA